MDHATLTDNTGRKADFRQVILIMTSNAGSREMSQALVGFSGPMSSKGAAGRAKQALERIFSPEFRNRLDATVTFGTLTPAVVETIVEKFVLQLEAQLAERRVAITLEPEARAWLADEGLRPDLRRPAAGARHPGRGARPADRRDPLRPPRTRRHGEHRPQGRRADVRHRQHPAPASKDTVVETRSMSEQEPVKVVDRRWWARTEDTPASDSEPVVFDKPSYVQELEQKLAEKDAQLQEYVTLVHEAQREFDAMRARVRKDAARDAEMSRRSVFADLLEVIDNLDRALGGRACQAAAPISSCRASSSCGSSSSTSSRATASAASSRSANRSTPRCTRPSPWCPVTDQYGEGIVAGVAAPGYLIGDDVLRPATVAVASNQ